jgi:phage terminase small subunit
MRAKPATPLLSLPRHLQPATRSWAQGILEAYVLESHHLKILIAAAESWDRKEQARAALAEHGAVYTDRFGQPRSRPEVAIERDARIAFARLIRELALDVEQPDEARPPTIPGSASLRRVSS